MQKCQTDCMPFLPCVYTAEYKEQVQHTIKFASYFSDKGLEHVQLTTVLALYAKFMYVYKKVHNRF